METTADPGKHTYQVTEVVGGSTVTAVKTSYASDSGSAAATSSLPLSNSAKNTGKGGLSTGGKAAIGVAVPLGVIAIALAAAAAIIWVRRRERRRRTEVEQPIKPVDTQESPVQFSAARSDSLNSGSGSGSRTGSRNYHLGIGNNNNSNMHSASAAHNMF